MSPRELDYVNDDTYERLVGGASESRVLLDFGAEWCEPCLAMEPILQEVADQYAGKLLVLKVDLDESPGLAEQFDVISIPAYILLQESAIVHRVQGARSKASLIAEIEKTLNP